MKFTRRNTAAALVWACCLACAACAVHESANPAQRCAGHTDCPAGLICYRDFCLPGPEAPDAPQSDLTAAHADGHNDASQAGTARATASPSLEPVADASGAGPLPDSDDSGVLTDSGQPTGTPTEPIDASTPVVDSATSPAPAGSCDREVLRQSADAYLAAMATGDVASLSKHPSLLYTENGQKQQLGLGVWIGRPRAQFVRLVLDEGRCSAAIVAVLRGNSGRTIFGVRLRYLAGQLFEVEAQVVPQNPQFFNPDGIIPTGADPWVEPVPAGMRMSRDGLNKLLADYFDSSTEASLLPPSAPSCRRRQNGVLMPQQGSCRVPPGSHPFEEKRYPLVDETNGIATAIVIYDRYLGMYLFKVSGNEIQMIDIVGGAQSQNSGW